MEAGRAVLRRRQVASGPLRDERPSNPDHIVVGQELEIPYVTYRYRVKVGDKKADLALRYYNDVAMSAVYEIPNGAAQRDLVVGEWLLIPDLANPGHHTVVAGETLEVLAERWYGDKRLDSIIAIANHLGDPRPDPGRGADPTEAEPAARRGCRRHAVEPGGRRLRRLRRRSDADLGQDGGGGELHQRPRRHQGRPADLFPSFDLGG